MILYLVLVTKYLPALSSVAAMTQMSTFRKDLKKQQIGYPPLPAILRSAPASVYCQHLSRTVVYMVSNTGTVLASFEHVLLNLNWLHFKKGITVQPSNFDPN